MTNWKAIIETWNALPEADRTSRGVHLKLLEQGHSISHPQVQTVLCATVASEMLDDNDFRVTVKTLNTLIDLCSHSFAGEIRVSNSNTYYAESLTAPLRHIIGPDVSDLVQALARLSADHDMATEVAAQFSYDEMMREREMQGDDDRPF